MNNVRSHFVRNHNPRVVEYSTTMKKGYELILWLDSVAEGSYTPRTIFTQVVAPYSFARHFLFTDSRTYE